MALCAVAVAALAIGPFIYRALLPARVGATPASCSFVVATAGLFVLFVGAAIWQLRRRRRPRETELDRRLWEAALGRGERDAAAGVTAGSTEGDAADSQVRTAGRQRGDGTSRPA